MIALRPVMSMHRRLQMLMLNIIGSLVFTKLHLNKYLRFLLEIWVIVYTGVVAVQVTPIDPNSEKLSNWPMFVFVFATITLLTQV